MFKSKKNKKEVTVTNEDLKNTNSDVFDAKNIDFYGNVTKYDFVDDSIFKSTLDLEEAEE